MKTKSTKRVQRNQHRDAVVDELNQLSKGHDSGIFESGLRRFLFLATNKRKRNREIARLQRELKELGQ